MKKEAVLSEDRKYRYLLSLTWDDTKPTVLFIGLNPSTADEKEDTLLLINVSVTLKVGDMEKYLWQFFLLLEVLILASLIM